MVGKPIILIAQENKALIVRMIFNRLQVQEPQEPLCF